MHSGVQERVPLGSQLIANFQNDDDAQATLDMVRQLVVATLGHVSAVRLEVATACIVVYITFLEKDLSIDKLVRELRLKGARLTFTEDPDGQCSSMVPVGDGVSRHCEHAALHRDALSFFISTSRPKAVIS